jgi:hypothetical protein
MLGTLTIVSGSWKVESTGTVTGRTIRYCVHTLTVVHAIPRTLNSQVLEYVILCYRTYAYTFPRARVQILKLGVKCIARRLLSTITFYSCVGRALINDSLRDGPFCTTRLHKACDSTHQALLPMRTPLVGRLACLLATRLA